MEHDSPDEAAQNDVEYAPHGSSVNGKGKKRTGPGKKSKIKVGPRASIACTFCRKRKIRCSGEYPTCGFCEAKGKQCVYDAMPPPRTAHAHPENGHSPKSGSERAGSPVDAACLPPGNVQMLAFIAFCEHFVDAGLFTFVHRQTMIEAITAGKAPLELVLAILALSARFEPQLADLHESHTAAAKYYAGKALAIVRADPDAAALTRIQVLLMLALHDCTEGHESRGWILLGVAVRLCSILRLARFEPPDDGHVGPSSVKGAPQTPLDSEIRRRTYWSAFMLDRLMCDGHERLSMLRIDPYGATIRMPRSDADFEYGNWALTARFEDDIPSWARSEEAARKIPQEPEADLYGQALRISDIWSKVMAYVGAGGHNIDRRAPWNPESSFAKLEASLARWYNSLPDSSKYTEANRVAHAMIGKGQLFALVHLIYHGCLLYLHRDYIPFAPAHGVFDPSEGFTEGDALVTDTAPPPNFWLNLRNTAFQSADYITDLVRSVNGGFAGGSLLGHPFVGFAVLTAATMHAHRHFFSADRSPRDQEYVIADAQILERYRSYWSVAAQWCRGLGLLYDLFGAHRDMAAFSMPATGLTDRPWARTRDDVMRIVPQSEEDVEKRGTYGELKDELAQHSDNAANNIAVTAQHEISNGLRRKRYDLFALVNGAISNGHGNTAVVPPSPLFLGDPVPSINDSPSEYWPLLETTDTDPFSLNSFTDWALHGVGDNSSWWLDTSP